MEKVVEVRHAGGYNLWLRFSDGAEGTLNLEAELRGPVFEPLRDVSEFAKVSVYKPFGAVAWECGADLAPEFLHSRLMARAA